MIAQRQFIRLSALKLSNHSFKKFSGKVNQVKTVESFKSLLDAPGKKICYFTATWCGPCKRIGMIFFNNCIIAINVLFSLHNS